MRLNSFLAKAGISSRRGADDLIKTGRVRVNGRVGQLNDDVTQSDMISVDQQQVKMRKSRYILLYKPAGYVTTLKDEKKRARIIDLVNVDERVVPVGRLDNDTTGVLLLTNDGDLAHKLMHPRFKIDKVYEAEVDGRITSPAIRRLSKGVELEDGKTAPAIVRKISESKIELIIHEGRKHQVKRMLVSVGLPVKQLHRTKYAGLSLGGLKPGQWRDLTKQEVSKLK